MKVAIANVKILDRQRRDMGDIDAMANSLARYGQLQPIVVDDESNLVAGHRRLLAAMQLGWLEIEAVQRSGLDDLSRRELELEENIRRKDLVWPEEVRAVRDLYRMRQSRYGDSKVRSSVIRDVMGADPEGKTSYSIEDAAHELDRSKSSVHQAIELANALDEMPELEQEANRTAAWTRYVHEKEKRLREELAKRTRLHDEETQADKIIVSESSEDDEPKGPAPEGAHVRQPIYKAGWKGKGILYFADSRDVLRLLPTGSVDCLITDPPFALGMHKEGKAISGQRLAQAAGGMYDDDPFEMMQIIDEVLMLTARVLKPDGSAYVFFHMTRFEEMYKILRQHFGDCDPVPIIWIKNTPGIGDPNRTWVYAYEPIFWVNRGGRRLVKPQAFNYLKYDTIPHGQKTHPTAKPVQLLRHLVQAACVPGEVVLDPFAGSASTCIAAYQHGCKFYGIERHEAFYRAACENIATALAIPQEADGSESAYEAAQNLAVKQRDEENETAEREMIELGWIEDKCEICGEHVGYFSPDTPKEMMKPGRCDEHLEAE